MMVRFASAKGFAWRNVSATAGWEYSILLPLLNRAPESLRRIRHACSRTKQANADLDVAILRTRPHQTAILEIVVHQAARRPGNAFAFTRHIDQQHHRRGETRL